MIAFAKSFQLLPYEKAKLEKIREKANQKQIAKDKQKNKEKE